MSDLDTVAERLSDEQIDAALAAVIRGISSHGTYGGAALDAIPVVVMACAQAKSANALRGAETDELHRMQLTAIAVISLFNTRESLAKQTLPKDNPYWTPAWESVARAIGREIEEREALAAARAALRTVRPFRAGYEVWLKEHAAAIEDARKP